MKDINVYGSGCANCGKTMMLIQKVGDELGIAFQLNKITDLQKIMEAGVVSTPAVGIDGKLVHSGSVPDENRIRSFLK